MTDEPTVAGVDVATLRERCERDVPEAVDAEVLATIEARAVEDGIVSVDAFADWHGACDRERRSVEERLAAFEGRLEDYRGTLDEEAHALDHVRSQFAGYVERFGAMRETLETAATHLEETPRRPTAAAALYAGAERLSACEELVHGVEHRLEHFEQEFDWFESWLFDPAARVAGFDDELDAVEGYLGRVERLLAEVEAHAGDPPEGYDPFDAWVGARHLHLLAAVALEEFRDDVVDLERWLEGAHDEAFAALIDRLAALEERHAALEGKFDTAADAIGGFEAAHAEVAGSIERFAADLDDLSPPIDWTRVNDRLRAQFDELGVPYG